MLNTNTYCIVQIRLLTIIYYILIYISSIYLFIYSFNNGKTFSAPDIDFIYTLCILMCPSKLKCYPRGYMFTTKLLDILGH